MTCAKDVRLKAIYDAALSAWLGRRQGIINGVRPPEATFQFSKAVDSIAVERREQPLRAQSQLPDMQSVRK
jgi:hypothetical protein